MSDGVLCVLTSKSVESILKAGGSQSWVLDKARARSCKYMVLCKNAKGPYVEGPEEHHHAFLIGKIKDVVPSSEAKGRWLVLLSEYVTGDFGDEWYGRNPVQYWREEGFPKIRFNELKFVEMPGNNMPTAQGRGMSIEEAKQGLATRFGVNAADIEIVIRA